MQNKALDRNRYTLCICALVATLAGCGGSGSGTVPAAAARRTVNAVAPMASSYQVLHRFSGMDGAQLDTGLIEVNHLLYGTTTHGGAYDRGTFYSITSAGYEKVLYHFGKGSDGATPKGRLIVVNGTFFGTTRDGGSSKSGTVYSMKVLVRGIGVETLLHSFTGYPSDGDGPVARLVNVNGTFYGTTFTGGSSGNGTVFRITADGKEKVLYSFAGGSDGSQPYAGVVEVNGTLYGTTVSGGGGCPKSNRDGCGTVFSISTTGDEKVLHSFTGGSDGAYPQASLINVKGTLYGTTPDGGAGCNSSDGCGTVYSISTTGTETILHRFTRKDGASPIAGLTDGNGTLFGATSGGGSNGNGVIYSITTTGTEKSLHEFRTTDEGWLPLAAPIYVNGMLYGTTDLGGGLGCKNFAGCGTAYVLTL